MRENFDRKRIVSDLEIMSARGMDSNENKTRDKGGIISIWQVGNGIG
jgi:hypothetical protein